MSATVELPRGERTRAAILQAAVRLATVDGLEGLTLGNLARSLAMSKSGLYAHFGSKEQLQLATVDEAGRIFQSLVTGPALAGPDGVTRLLATCEAFLAFLETRMFPGGCFFAGAVLEMGTRPGPVRDRVAAFQTGFTRLLHDAAAAAIEAGELPATEDPAAVAFELNGLILAADARFVLADDEAVLDLARSVVRRRLGVPGSTGS